MNSEIENEKKDLQSYPPSTELQNETFLPPDSGYAWLVMIGGIFTLIMTFGVMNSFGVLQTYFLQTLFVSEPARKIAWISTIAQSCIYFGGIIAAPLISKYGFRKTNFIGTIVATTGLILASFSTKVWQLVLTQGMIFGLGGAINLNVSLVMPSLWFEKRRSLVIGIILAGTALGSLALTPMLNAVLTHLNAAWVYRIMAALYFILTGFSWIVSKARTPFLPPKKAIDLTKLKDPVVFLLFIGGYFTSVGYLCHILYFPPSVVATGRTRTDATNLIMIFSVFSAIGRIGSGQLAPHLGSVNILLVSHGITGITMLTMWNLSRNYTVYLIFYGLVGLFSVPFFVLSPVIVAQQYPKEQVSLINGLTYIGMGFSALTGVPVSGLVLDVIGKRKNYSSIIYIASGCYLITLVVFSRLWLVLKKRDPLNKSWII